MVSNPIEKSRSHFCIAEDRDPFLEIQICGEDHGRALIQRADEMKDISKSFLGPARLWERPEQDISQFIQNKCVHLKKLALETTGFPFGFLLNQSINQINNIKNLIFRPLR